MLLTKVDGVKSSSPASSSLLLLSVRVSREILLHRLDFDLAPLFTYLFPFSQNWYQLFIIRFLMGVAFGAKNATVPIFSAGE